MVEEPRSQGTPRRTAEKSNIKVYNRLVRDKMPDIIESMGNLAVYGVLDDTAFSKALLETMSRGAAQFAKTRSLELLADVLECIDAWLEVSGLSMEEVERSKTERMKRCGTFHERVFLELVAEGGTADTTDTLLRNFHC